MTKIVNYVKGPIGLGLAAVATALPTTVPTDLLTIEHAFAVGGWAALTALIVKMAASLGAPSAG